MGITFEEVLKNNLISERALRLLPNKCKCGSKLEFSDSLRTLKCTNSKCIYQYVDRIERFSNKHNISIIHDDIIRVVKKLNIITPYQLLMLKDANTNNIINRSDITNIEVVIDELERIKNERWYIYQIAEMCGILEIEKIAHKIFDGFNSFDDAYEEVEQGQVSFIRERLGIKSSDSSMLAVEIYDTLMKLKEEFMFAEALLNVKKYEQGLVRIAFADNNVPFINKSETIKYLDGISKYKFVLVSTINNDTDILVKNADGANAKCRAARIINDKFIADEMNNNGLKLCDINKKVKNSLKPLGSKIYIDTLENVIDRLKEISNYE